MSKAYYEIEYLRAGEVLVKTVSSRKALKKELDHIKNVSRRKILSAKFVRPVTF